MTGQGHIQGGFQIWYMLARCRGLGAQPSAAEKCFKIHAGFHGYSISQ